MADEIDTMATRVGRMVQDALTDAGAENGLGRASASERRDPTLQPYDTMVVAASPFRHTDSVYRNKHGNSVAQATRAMTNISLVAPSTVAKPEDNLSPENEKIINRWESSLKLFLEENPVDQEYGFPKHWYKWASPEHRVRLCKAFSVMVGTDGTDRAEG
ncbi:MAG: hypothetical protein VX223_10125, partial [Myxococcota bacterium]|nr:hypothetical protein [Myxococcota bacterium]